MLRQVELNNQLCLQDENHELFLKHDLKGNQFDTLASLFYREHSQGLLSRDPSELVGPSLNFYRECEKEAIESVRQCCKHGNFRVLWEFYLYERLCANSANRVVVDQVLADQLLHNLDKKGGSSDSGLLNAQWFLDSNYDKLFRRKHKLSFNADLVQMQFQAYFTRSVFNFDLVGPLKDIHFLKAKCLIDRSLVKVLLGKTNELDPSTATWIHEEIGQINIENTKSFEDYFVFRRVNNPTLASDLGQRTMYGKENLESHLETMKTGLNMMKEFFEFCLLISPDKPETTKVDESCLDCKSLDRVKTTIDNAIKKVLIPDRAAFSGGDFFVISHLLRTMFTLINIFSKAGADLKTHQKQYTKGKGDSDKEKVANCMSQYTSLKDYFKKTSTNVEDSLQVVITTKQYELKDAAFNEIGLNWPTIIKDNHPKLASKYTSMIHNAILELQTKLSMMRKAIN